jgi:Sec-independent protein translocase protein TatA
MSIQLAILILVVALLVLITAQLRAIAGMIRETLDAVEVPTMDVQAEPNLSQPSQHVEREFSAHLTLVK